MLIYKPPYLAEDEEIEKNYEESKELVQCVKGDKNLMIMVDFSAQVGEAKQDRGSPLTELC